MKKIIIGIIARTVMLENGKSYVGAYRNYLKMIINNGGIPIIITPYDEDELFYLLNKCDGILAPGGDDFDNYDLAVYEYAVLNDIPYLGICLGMQAMSGELNLVNNHYLTNHKIYTNKNSKLYQIYQKDYFIVNSRHHYKITNVNNNMISAISEDGTIEALERTDKKFIIGVQWHPEDMEDNLLFEQFIKSCL